MSLRAIEAAEVATGLTGSPPAFDTIVDARSPAEFADDRVPGAVNWPVLSDDERREVGTLHKQVSAFEARKTGAALVARNIARHLERHVRERPREWSPLVYCWRGGQRSGTLAWFLDKVGFRVTVLRGGYKAFRRVVIDQLEVRPRALRFIVICGRTGCGKTRLLHALHAAGEQVLDLEGLARHRGSVLGGLPGTEQPSQRDFETQLWQAIAAFDPARPVWVESESRKIGNLHLPPAVIGTMREHGRCIEMQVPEAARVQLLLDDYAHLTRDPSRYGQLLDSLIDARGRALVQQWRSLAERGDWAGSFARLIHDHYDPGYLESIRRNFRGFEAAEVLPLPDAGATTLADAARRLVEAMSEGWRPGTAAGDAVSGEAARP